MKFVGIEPSISETSRNRLPDREVWSSQFPFEDAHPFMTFVMLLKDQSRSVETQDQSGSIENPSGVDWSRDRSSVYKH